MWFGYYPEIIFCHFFCNLNLVIFKCTIMAGDINSLNLLVDDDTVLFYERKVQRSTQVRLFKACLSALHETWDGLDVENCQF